MKISIPTNYNANYILPRKRLENSTSLFTTANVDIQEIDGDDAPIIHILGSNPTTEPNVHKRGVVPRYQKIDGKLVDIRKYDGDLYVRIASVETMLDQLRGTDINPRHVFSNTTYGRVLAGMYSHDEGPTYKSFESFLIANNIDKVRRVEVNLDEVLEAPQDYADDLLIIDGHVYEKTVEPALSLVPSPGIIELRLSEAYENDINKSRNHLQSNDDIYSIRFGLDEYERAVEEGEKIAEEDGVRFVNNVSIEHVSNWEIDFRGELETLYKKASRFVSMTTNMVHAFDKFTARAWYHLSEAIELHDQTTPLMIDAMRRVAASDENSFSANFQSNMSSIRTFRAVVEGVKQGIRLWDSRSHGLMEWFDTSLATMPDYVDGKRIWEVVDARTMRIMQKKLGLDDQTLARMMRGALEGHSSVVAVGPDTGLVDDVMSIMSVSLNDELIIEDHVSTSKKDEEIFELERLAQGYVGNALDQKKDINIIASMMS